MTSQNKEIYKKIERIKKDFLLNIISQKTKYKFNLNLY